MKEKTMKSILLRDVVNTTTSIYSWNAPHAIGYLFNPNKQGNEIAKGMYCDRPNEIDHNQWAYFVAFVDNRNLNVKPGFIYELKEDKEKTQLHQTCHDVYRLRELSKRY